MAITEKQLRAVGLPTALITMLMSVQRVADGVTTAAGTVKRHMIFAEDHAKTAAAARTYVAGVLPAIERAASDASTAAMDAATAAAPAAAAAVRDQVKTDADRAEAAAATVPAALAGKADAGAMFHPAPAAQALIVSDQPDGSQIVLLGANADGTGAGLFPTKLDLAAVEASLASKPGATVPWEARFQDGQTTYAFAEASSNGTLLRTWDAAGNQLFPAAGGGAAVDFSALPTTARATPDNAPWRDRWSVRIKRPLGNIYTTPLATLFPNHAAIYARMDALMAEFPTYVTRTLIGKSVNNLDIYAYHAKPSEYAPDPYGTNQHVQLSNRPKLLLTGGLHPDETHNMVANVAFFESLVREWRTRAPFEELRWGCEIVLAPCLNPDGFNLGQRRNARDVDLNRNFPTDWVSVPASEGRGASAGSEPETQVAISFVTANLGAFALIDHHRMFRQLAADGSERMLWIGAAGNWQMALAGEVIDNSVAESRRLIPTSFGPQDNPRAGHLTNPSAATFARHAQTMGLPSAYLLETPDEIGGTIADTREHAERMLINLVTAAYRRERRRRELQ